ncbi:cyclic AMP-responsive element-binding protein 3-like protein 2 isoform X2 [Canis lupus baileyi]|uniref:cyclic AMP-responsive element-binding protein 3-like protein 2 n=1 Tax=Canis lupus familiaris TaxID=9615 RepID=UPI0003ADC46E|nr:cyclic AMP-responsive element-binding protein 3-like protein 2 isoform X2 [Canis lupus dingo]XP_038415407.1 cyclic AMP-responsive element-binding protein 3-like protein 2 [Canis lupus familiaris]XP_038545136.1 cyclic AMP-responsive element-binding protein 3-like protein 2 [Canis lupus familiaris]|eukprot:XP_005629662.1 cyclic AMP-responsive element-binding protein 3-like protein 2 [Canis lupus familiaris]
MEVLESGEQSVLQWDRKLSELSEPGETEALMYHTPVIMVKAAGMVAAELGQILPFTTSAVEFLRRHSEAHIICSCVCLKRPSVNKS